MLWSIYSRPKFSTQMPQLFFSKFVSQLKLIQSVVQVGILGICVTGSILRVLLSGFWTSGSQIPSPRDPVLGSWVSGSQFQGPGHQGLVSQGPRAPNLECQCPWVPGLRVPSLRLPGLRVSGSRVSGFQVSRPDFRLCPVKTTL